MRRIILIVPEWVASPDGESVLRQALPGLSLMAERGAVFKIRDDGNARSPEAEWLGIDPKLSGMEQGPLTVAALGADPPDRSVHFHLSLMSFQGGVARVVAHEVGQEEVRLVIEAVARLNTKSLTLVPGDGVDHGLVWEAGSLDLRTAQPEALDGESVAAMMPAGDGENMLRRYIDDSVNLLSELAINEIRLEEGLQPLNLMWPWGQGFREPVPNLLLRRGERAWIESDSLRLQGLARLAGYRHGDRNEFGRGTGVRLERLAEACLDHDVTIVVLKGIGDFRSRKMLEEASWLTREIDDRLLSPLIEAGREEAMRIVIAAPHAGAEGLGLWFESKAPVESSVPFDERALEEKGPDVRELWKVVDRAVMAK